MKHLRTLTVALGIGIASGLYAQQFDPTCVVEKWSEVTGVEKVIDINFSDPSMPNTWKGTTGKDTPAFTDGGYYSGELNIPVLTEGEPTGVTYPLLFHNCTFANKNSYGGFAGATAAFSRQYYLGENATTKNDWKQEGHKEYLEDNITYGSNGKPNYGEAGYVHLCRDGAVEDENGNKTCMHGWVEIDHLPYVERVQWSWSSSAWGRGVKCDIKIGDGEWEPLVWMGNNLHKTGYTVYSDQGYFMDNEIKASDVSLRWRIWDGDPGLTTFQTNADGTPKFNTPINPMGQWQPVKIHKIKIYGNNISAEQAQYARNNHIGDYGEFTFGQDESDVEKAEAQDTYSNFTFAVVDPAGKGDYTTIQAAIDAIPNGNRGILFIRNGVYEENVYAGTSTDRNKFISLIGESRDGVVLTSKVSRGDGTKNYNDCAALNVYVNKFYAENLTIRNTSGNVGQAEALYTNGDAHIFRNCNITGYQDTYKSNSGSRGYFYNCYIEGATDFIYDSGLEWFEHCTINCVANNSYVTAAGDASLSMTKVLFPSISGDVYYAGLFFNDCDLTASSSVSAQSCYLGRPWKDKCGTTFVNCRIGDHIAPEGWKPWNTTDCSYYEYGSTDANGNVLDVSGRVAWSAQATQAEAEAYFNTSFLFSAIVGKETFTPEAIIAASKVPAATMSKGKITWEKTEGAIGYLIFKNGEFNSFCTELEMPADTEYNDIYTIKSVSRRGITSEASTATKPLKAFPSAYGFGQLASGGRGGEVVYVTTLADNVEGSLRWAFAQHEGKPITIVFAVSGEIVLESELKVARTDWTLAGQSAPGEGIVITHHKVNFGGSQNFIVRNVRFRIGQRDTQGNILAENACGAENCSNYIFDHCTFGWSVEENFNTFDSHFLTIQNSIVHEGLYSAGHSKGSRGYGCQWGGSPATYHHNLLAHNNRRSCRFNGSRGEDFISHIEYFNNVCYNYEGGGNGCYGGENTANITEYNELNSAHECNFVNNYYKPGPNTTSTPYFVMPSLAREGATSWGPSKWYFSGNIMEGHDDMTTDNWKGVNLSDVSGKYTAKQLTSTQMIRPTLNYYKYSSIGNEGTYDYDLYAYAQENYQSAQEALGTVTAMAGTMHRDAVEKRIIADLESGKATYGGVKGAHSGIIDKETDAEGFVAYAEYTPIEDTDRDGMPDAWETEHGCDPQVADNNTLSESGYTMLEVYLNSFFAEDEDLMSSHNTALHNVMAQQILSNNAWIENNTVYCSVAANYTVTIYDMAGMVIARTSANGQEISLQGMPQGVSLVVVSAPGVTTRVLKATNK